MTQTVSVLKRQYKSHVWGTLFVSGRPEQLATLTSLSTCDTKTDCITVENAHLGISLIASDIHHQILNSHFGKRSKMSSGGYMEPMRLKLSGSLNLKFPIFTILGENCPKLDKLHPNYIKHRNDGDDDDDELIKKRD